MTNESMLQKDFKQRDVQRMRNLITKNYGDKTVTQAGYTKETIEHKEGDVWEENGKTWTIKNSLKQTITRLDSIKKSIMLPLTCPNCSKPMKNDTLNKKMWPIHKMCFNCVITMETKLKREGKFEEYERNMTRKGIETYIKELEEALLELSLSTTEDQSIVTESGDIEHWVGGNIDKQKILQDLQEHIQKLKDIVNS
jgi:hypothetical protein